jgi:predicted S18 family serine protease
MTPLDTTPSDLSEVINNLLVMTALIGGILLAAVLIWYARKTYLLHEKAQQTRLSDIECTNRDLKDTIEQIKVSTNSVIKLGDNFLQFAEQAKQDSIYLRESVFQLQAWVRKSDERHLKQVTRTEANENFIQLVDNKVEKLGEEVKDLKQKVNVA